MPPLCGTNEGMGDSYEKEQVFSHGPVSLRLRRIRGGRRGLPQDVSVWRQQQRSSQWIHPITVVHAGGIRPIGVFWIHNQRCQREFRESENEGLPPIRGSGIPACRIDFERTSNCYSCSCSYCNVTKDPDNRTIVVVGAVSQGEAAEQEY